MKVLLKKSTEDMNWGGDDYDGTVKRMYLHLRVDCEKDSSVVKSISLKCALLDDVERMYDDNKVDWDRIQKCLMEYFQSTRICSVRVMKIL